MFEAQNEPPQLAHVDTVSGLSPALGALGFWRCWRLSRVL